MSRRLQNSLSKFNRSLAKEEEIILGDLGITKDGKRLVNVPNRFPFVYVRLRSSTSELIQAYNDKVSPAYDLPVRLKREGGRYIVIGRYGERYSDWVNNNPYTAKHSESHVFDKEGGNVGDDPVWVYPYQFMPSLVSPFGVNGSQNVFLHPYLYYKDSTWKYLGNTGTPDLVSHKPVGSGSYLILISHEVESGNPILTYATGTYIPDSYTGTAQLRPYIPATTNDTDIPLAFVRLVSGTNQITWNNIYDARQFFGGSSTALSPSTGTSSGGIDGIVFQDEGIVQGTGTVINFVGNNVSVTISGTVARVYVTGSAGGGLTLGTGSDQAASGTHTHPSSAVALPNTFCAILSLSSTEPVPTSELTGQGTLYLHPFMGNVISLYDGSEWQNHTLSSAISLTFSGLATASTCYDIFVYDSGGLTLEAVAWTNATTRATANVLQDGIKVKSGATGRRYVGTVYIDGSKQASMEYTIATNTTTIGRRHVYNYYHRHVKGTKKVSTTAHTYNSSTYRKWNNTDVLSIEVVLGYLEDDITVFAGGNQNTQANMDVAVNWTSGGGELVDWYNATAGTISAFTGGVLKRGRISTEGLATIVVLESATSGTANFNTGVLEVVFPQ